MVKTFKVYLGSQTSNTTVYSCAHCRAHLAKHENLISKSFQGSQGRAYLFDAVVNVATGKPEERVLLTGLHSVADIKCEGCRTVLGWKYEQAFEPSQKYKEGKYIIEVAHLIKDTNWDNMPSTSSAQQCSSPTLSLDITSSMFQPPSSVTPLVSPHTPPASPLESSHTPLASPSAPIVPCIASIDSDNHNNQATGMSSMSL